MRAFESPPVTTLRVVGRLSVAFLLEQIRVGRQGREFLDALILLAIIQANLGRLMRDPEMQLVYGAYDAPPPDALRRPVSVHAVAQSLNLPYETVRRHVAQLAAGGLCEPTSEGVYVGGAALHSPGHEAAARAICAGIRDLYLRLRALGALADLPQPDPGLPATGPETHVRVMLRVSSDYVLRFVEALTLHIGDLVRGIVWLGILRANTEHLADAERGLEGVAQASFVADELRRPVRVAALAERLEIPEETLRRHAARLVKDHLAVRTRQGLLVPAEVLARPNLLRVMAENHGHLRRMFAALAQLGVTAAWDHEALEPARP